MDASKPGKERLGIGMLCRRGCEGFGETLRSYAEGGLFEAFGEARIEFQGLDGRGTALAGTYGLDWDGGPEDGTLAAGLRRLAETLRTDVILFLEQDAALVGTRPAARIEDAAALLLSGRAQVVRLGARVRTEVEDGRRTGYERFWGPGPIAPLRRATHPIRARRCAGAAVYLHERADRRHRGLIDRADDGSYLVSAACLPWTSRSVMVRRDFLLERILPQLERTRRGRTEGAWDGRAWRYSGWRVGVPEGLFA